MRQAHPCQLASTLHLYPSCVSVVVIPSMAGPSSTSSAFFLPSAKNIHHNIIPELSTSIHKRLVSKEAHPSHTPDIQSHSHEALVVDRPLVDSMETMQAPILSLSQCPKKIGLAGVFLRHLQASMATFAISSFLILLFTAALFIIIDVPYLKSLCGARRHVRASSINFSTAPATDSESSLHIISRPVSPKPRAKTIAKFLGCSSLLAAAAILLASQILFTLTIWSCEGPSVHQQQHVLLCVITAIGAVLITLGLLPWSMSAWNFGSEWFDWIRSERRHRITKGREAESASQRQINLPVPAPVLTDQPRIIEGQNQPALSTPPPYTAR